MRRYITIFGIAIGIAMLFLIGCKKSNHDMLLLLGDESYLKSIDEIYPRKYREEWPEIASDYYHLNTNNEIIPKLNEGLFPPDITGEYNFRLQYKNGKFQQYWNGLYIDIYGSDMTMKITILNQKNSYAEMDFELDGRSIPVNGAYVYGTVDPGNSNKGEITICFEFAMGMGDITMTTFYGGMLTGDYDSGYIKNARFWIVINDRYPIEEMNFSYKLGGQQFYLVGN